MKFTGIIDRKDTIIIDGYSNKKTVKAAIKEFGTYIKKHVNEMEGNCIIENGIESILPACESCGGYFLEIENVPCACEYDEKTDTMKYSDGNYYLVCRIVK